MSGCERAIRQALNIVLIAIFPISLRRFWFKFCNLRDIELYFQPVKASAHCLIDLIQTTPDRPKLKNKLSAMIQCWQEQELIG